jgi:phosphoglucosamine mutase
MEHAPRLFGTDGVRGVAGQYPLDRRTVHQLGVALACVLEVQIPSLPLHVVLGEDTRESSPWISRVLAAGLKSRGIEVVYAGVITTPGVAFLTRHHGFAAGVMVSASHNPYQDNGIKILSSSGTKLSEILELEVERALNQVHVAAGTEVEASLHPVPELLRDYVKRLVELVSNGSRVPGLRLVIDCAHGSASHVVPQLMAELGVEARVLNAEPSGRNINLNCGSLHPEMMAQETQRCGADLGVAFDGDADRAIFATREGRIAGGDHVLFVMAPFLKSRQTLRGGAVVGTLMTNLGLELALARESIGLKRTAVGDKYVLEEMLRSGINLGGEPSGHIIFADVSLAGDGMITLLEILGAMSKTGRTLQELVRGLALFPQVILNVRVRDKPPLESIPEVAQAIARCRSEFGSKGRAVVRYSGTEHLVRVMVEAEDPKAVQENAARIAHAVASRIGMD